MNACSSATDAISDNEAQGDLDSIFIAEYRGVARTIATINRDPARAEELAVEVFLKWSQNSLAHGENARGWLYRTAVRMALDDLRAQLRRSRYHRLLSLGRISLMPDEIVSSKREQEQVRAVLAAMAPRQAELLLLRSQGFDYQELSAAIHVKTSSIGTLLARAQNAFRKEYVRLYGEP